MFKNILILIFYLVSITSATNKACILQYMYSIAIFDGGNIDRFDAKLAIHQKFPLSIVSSGMANTGELRCGR